MRIGGTFLEIVYELIHMEGLLMPHSFKIVDTPEYSSNDGLDGDLEISKSVRKYKYISTCTPFNIWILSEVSARTRYRAGRLIRLSSSISSKNLKEFVQKMIKLRRL